MTNNTAENKTKNWNVPGNKTAGKKTGIFKKKFGK